MNPVRVYGNSPVAMTGPLKGNEIKSVEEIPVERITTEVLVVGAGVAGCLAALCASESGLDATLVEKAWVDRSGQAGAGNDHIMAHFNQGPNDSDEAFNKWARSDTLCDISVYDKVVTKNIPEVIRRLDGFGIKFLKNRKTGGYLRTQSLGQPAPWWLMIRNADSMKPKIANTLRRSNVRLANWVMVTRLFTSKKNKGQVIGAAGFNIRKGNFCVFDAKCTILATGDVVRLASNSTGNPYNSFISPYGTGSAQALAFEAGADIADLELGKATLIPKGFSAPGMNAIAGLDAYLINSKGERYMFRYHPLGEKAPRFDMVYGTVKEIAEGRGPCYVDMRHLPADDRQMLIEELLSVDKLTYRDYLKAKKVDLSSALLEIEAGEINTWKGLLVNERSECSVPGLYAAGSCASIMNWGGVSVAMASGISAGKEAAAHAKSISIVAIPEDDIKEAKEFTFSPLFRGRGIKKRSDELLSPAQFEDQIRFIIAKYLAKIRTGNGLKEAMTKFRKLESQTDNIRAKDLHELLRLHEALHLLTTVRLLAIGAYERKESRVFHWRSDYPSQKEPAEHVILTKKKGQGEDSSNSSDSITLTLRAVT
jgi:adenylylsulfate reductase subunit A